MQTAAAETFQGSSPYVLSSVTTNRIHEPDIVSFGFFRPNNSIIGRKEKMLEASSLETGQQKIHALCMQSVPVRALAVPDLHSSIYNLRASETDADPCPDAGKDGRKAFIGGMHLQSCHTDECME